MKLTQLFMVAIMLPAFFVSCSNEDEQAGLENSELYKSVDTKSDYDIAKEYAPVFYQDLDKTDGICRNQSKSGSADWIAAVNYDGDWNGSNNWENLVRERAAQNIKATVYYTVNETETHFYVLYSVFHPRDWTDIPFICGLDSHENDMEGVLICARKNGNDFGDVEYASSIFHSDRRNYRANQLLFSRRRTRMFIEAKGHGMRKYNGSSDEDGTFIKYVFGTRVTQPSDSYPNTSRYSLTTLQNIWDQRNNTDLFAGNSFRGDNGRDNAANAPWAWGDIAKNPAVYINNTFNSGLNTNYVRERQLQE